MLFTLVLIIGADVINLNGVGVQMDSYCQYLSVLSGFRRLIVN